MKKIGILTYHSVCNFGANLQALSTVGYFRKHGFDPIVINWVPNEIEQQYKKSIPTIQYAEHEIFVRNYLPVTVLCRTEEDILECIHSEGIDAVVIGSDAVAQHKSFFSRVYFPTRTIFTVTPLPPPHLLFPNPFWGSFIHKLRNKIPVAMMSVSSQNEQYLGIQGKIRDKAFETLKALSYISVRDHWTQKMFLHLSRDRIKPPVTPDPVFSFNQNAGELILSKKNLLEKFQLPSKYILLSFVEKHSIDEAWLEEFVKIATSQKFDCIMLPMPSGHAYQPVPGMKQLPLPLSPLDWYGLIKYSSAYVGHNMHPMVVAMHNNVPFYVFDYYGILYLRTILNSKSSKIYDILNMANMLNQRSRDIGMICIPPKPRAVFNSITELRKNSTLQSTFSATILNDYNSMMSALVKAITIKASS